jgi:hypothetical protein
MGVVERRGDLGRNAERIGNRELLLALQSRAERLALDKRHHVIEEPAGLARVVQRQDVRMLQIGGEFDLAQEAFGAQHGRELRTQHLDRHVPVVPKVGGRVDRGHPALPELSLEAVAGSQGPH